MIQALTPGTRWVLWEQALQPEKLFFSQCSERNGDLSTGNTFQTENIDPFSDVMIIGVNQTWCAMALPLVMES